MTYIEQDIHDDASFCIGDEKEGFYASKSVCDSDISLTDGESEYDEDESICTNNECDDLSVYGSLEDIENVADSDQDMPDEISFRCGGCATDHADRSSDYECTKTSSDESIDTELTMACSELNGFEDGCSFHRNQYQEFCPQEYVHYRAVNVIDDDDEIDIPVLTDAQDNLCVDEMMAKATSMMVADEDFEDCCDHFVPAEALVNLSADAMLIEACNIMSSSDPEREEYGFISRETLEKVLYNPVQLAASLTVMAHLTVRDAKLSKSHALCEFEDEVPTIVV